MVSAPTPPRASAARSNLIPVTAAAAAPNAAATSRLAATEPVAATSNPATNGPAKVPSPSPMLVATLAATSSLGARAKAGRSAAWIGLMSDPDPATTAASTYVSSTGRSAATTSAVARAPAERTRLIVVSTRSPR